MATVQPYAPEVERLAKLYQRAEQDILDELSYKSYSQGTLAAKQASLTRVTSILETLTQKAGDIVPTLAYKQFVIGKKLVSQPKPYDMTSLDYSLVDTISNVLMGELTQAAYYANEHIQALWASSMAKARQDANPLLSSVFESIARGTAEGSGFRKAQAYFLEAMKEQGVVAFRTKTGAQYNIRTYANMAIRTATRQATNLGNIFADPDHDLYKISSHATTCNICAPLEGRVYSRSGTSTVFPPLALAFGKIDANGPDSLENSWLNIHPNCLHVILKYLETDPEQIQRDIDFSSYELNPVEFDPRSAAEIKRYHDEQQARQKLLRAHDQFERYKVVLGDDMPKTFQTFLKHKVNDSDKYKHWMQLYRKRNKVLES